MPTEPAVIFAMKAFLTAAGVLLNTLMLTCALLWVDPFDRISSVLDRAFGAAPKWTQVTNLVRDPLTQDIYHGEHPMTTFARVADYWRTQPGKKRVVLIGNSQMFSVSLAPGELPQPATERTYPDLIRPLLPSDDVLLYRLAAPGLSYSEALAEIDYLLCHPDLRPSLVVLQVNYQTFWNSGIRDSFFELLNDPGFHEHARQLAHSDSPYADDFATALTKYEERDKGPASKKPVQPNGFGSRLEDLTRQELSAASLFRRRPDTKDSFDELLYRARIYFLRIKPSTARSIMGPQLTRSQAALEAIAEACRASGVRLAIFTAPVNPAVSLYRSTEDKSRFQGFVHTVAERYRLPVVDLESSVSDRLWGRQLDGPDPLHMGRTAHTLVAGKMALFIRDVLEAH
jgi:hypothetical protein